ncbi:hypothetical protein MRX96_030541 [Rhipicephalus microplus]
MPKEGIHWLPFNSLLLLAAGLSESFLGVVCVRARALVVVGIAPTASLGVADSAADECGRSVRSIDEIAAVVDLSDVPPLRVFVRRKCSVVVMRAAWPLRRIRAIRSSKPAM